MAAEQRDDILMNFMQCTGLDDFDECIRFLETHGWDFQSAVNAFHDPTDAGPETNHRPTVRHPPPSSVLPNSGGMRPRPRHTEGDDDIARILPTYHASPPSTRFQRPTPPAAARPGARELEFEVRHNDQTVHIKLSDDQTVNNLREKIQEMLHIPFREQQIITWASKSYNDRTRLKDLKLPKNNPIHVIASASSIVPGRPPGPHSSGAAAAASPSGPSSRTAQPVRQHRGASPARAIPTRHADEFPVTVRYEDQSGRVIPCDLVFRTTTTVAEMKAEMEKHSKIPVRQQRWRELHNVDDTDTLRRAGIERRAILNLSRQEAPPQARPAPSHSRIHERVPAVRRVSDDDVMEIDDFEPAEIIIDDPPAAVVLSENRELLIPDGATDETAALENFNRVFHLRFHSTGPFLFMGPLEAAVQTALYAPLFDRRPLAIYLHHDRSICVNVFCTQVLCSDTIIEYLSNNYFVWAWDVTTDRNRKRFVEVLKRATNSQQIQRNIPTDPNTFPLMLVLGRNRGTVEIINMIEGKQTPEEVLEELSQCRDVFDQQRGRDVEEELARESRERLKKQQEDEYNQSMKADMAKDRIRQMEEIKRLDETRRTENLEQRRLREQQESQARLPAEPAENEPNITRFKIRLPDQRNLLRRFRLKETLQDLFDYLSSEGQLFGEYRLLTAYPKRDLTTLSANATLGALELSPQQFIVEKI